MPPVLHKSVSRKSWNILLYSVPGVGKTTLAAGAAEVPELGPVLIIDLDRGLRSVEHVKNLSNTQISSAAELEEVLWALTEPKSEFGAFKTVVLDSVTELVAMDIEDVAEAAAKAGRRPDRDQVQLLDYKWVGQRTLRLLRHLRDIPQNVIFTAKATKILPANAEGQPIPGSKPSEIFPTMPKKVREELAGMVDVVGYLNLESNGTRKLYTEAIGPILAKNRVAGFPAAIDNPTFAMLHSFLSSKTK